MTKQVMKEHTTINANPVILKNREKKIITMSEPKTIWVITEEHKHGTDVILIKQDEEPTNEEMEALKTIQFNTYDMNVWVELYSKFVLSELPTMKEYLKKLKE